MNMFELTLTLTTSRYAALACGASGYILTLFRLECGLEVGSAYNYRLPLIGRVR